MIVLTPNAISAARTIVSSAATPAEGLRILVEAGGCSGFQYKMEVAEASREGDTVIEAGDVKIFVDDMSQGMVQGMVVDYVSSFEKSGFTFENPNATTQCGCGKSFG